VITEPAKVFSLISRGYDPAAVDAYIKLLLDDVERLRARLTEYGDEVAVLRKEVAVLTDTSPHAMQHRMAEMPRRGVDEVSEMLADARAEAEAAQRKHKEVLADMTVQRKALEAECDETKKKLDAELARMRVETQSAIDEAWQDADQEHEQLLADAKQGADQYREQARRAADEASQQRIKILEQLVGICRDLEAVPAVLESVYQERKNPPEASVVVPLRPENQHGVSPR
jgi:cell division septum initiation protein DivIVA